MTLHDLPKDDDPGSPVSSIEEFLRRREDLDRSIRDRFQRPVAVAFTDIVASTDYFEKLGDLEGRLMLQRHHDLLRPVIEAHGGTVTKTLGDGLMVSFRDPVRAALAAAEIQRRLASENKGREPLEQIRVRIGMHWGLAIVEETDIHGDVPNTAARLCSLAKKGDILVSRSLVDAVRDAPEIAHEYVGAKTLKGKTLPVDVYRILWDPFQEADLKRTLPPGREGPESGGASCRLTFQMEDDILRIDASWGKREDGVPRSLRVPFQEREVRELVEEIDECLLGTDSRGRVSKEQVRRLENLGTNLYEILVPRDLAKEVLDRRPDSVLCGIDPALVHIPWELLHDGESFFCLKYSMGRMVLSSPSTDLPRGKSRPAGVGVLIVADPRGDLTAARAEGISVRRVFTRKDIPGLRVYLSSREATCAFLEDQLPQYDLFHYAGHWDFDGADPSLSGFLLSDGKFETGRLLGLARRKRLPRLVFANACRSVRDPGGSSGERLHGLAGGFLQSGVRHYIGSRLDVFDRSSSAFAREFYTRLLEGSPVGEALRYARQRSIEHYGKETLTWASYVLHGDPLETFPDRGVAPAGAFSFLSRFWRNKVRRWPVLSLVSALVLILGLFVLGIRRESPGPNALRRPGEEAFHLLHTGQISRAEGLLQSMTDKNAVYYQGLSALALAKGNVEEAREAWKSARSREPDDPYLDVLAARFALASGNTDEARLSFRKIANEEKLQPWQRAEIHLDLGRIELMRGSLNEALEEFDRALQADPAFLPVYTARGLTLERLGRLEGAVDSYEKGASVNCDDVVNFGLYRRSRQEKEARRNEEQKKRIDDLVAQLVQAYGEGPRSLSGADPWTSRPLSLFFLDLEPRGAPSPREGEDAFFSQLIAGELAECPRIQVVERALLDRLLEELRLSSSQLAEPQTALRLGKILSARVLCTGSILRHQGRVQLNLKAVDTETTRVMAHSSALVPGGEDPVAAVRKTSRQFRERLTEAYPVRCRIREVLGSQLTLNAGSLCGIATDMRLRVMEPEGKGAELVVLDVSDGSSTAVLVSPQARLQPGWRVEEIPGARGG
ncbi:MAG TPA: CHAT domain-containing protein [Syntrophobacteraceae bacterium]|nr:CHAT domain-containing protein [Syntrophobacteraceae bacterium]